MNLKPLTWSLFFTVLCLGSCAKSWASKTHHTARARSAEDRRLSPEERRLWRQALHARYALIWGSGPIWRKDTGLRDGLLTASGNETCVLVSDRRRIIGLWHALESTNRYRILPRAAIDNEIEIAFTNVPPKDGDMELGGKFIADIGFRWLGGKAYRQDADCDGNEGVYELLPANGARFEALIHGAMRRVRGHGHGYSFLVCNIKGMTPS